MADTNPTIPPTPAKPAAITAAITIIAMILAGIFGIQIPIEVQEQVGDVAARAVDLVQIIGALITAISVYFVAKPKPKT